MKRLLISASVASILLPVTYTIVSPGIPSSTTRELSEELGGQVGAEI